MAVSAVNNTTAFSVFTNYTANTQNLRKSMGRMSTGIKSVADDGAGVAISERMRSQARSTAMARNNADNAISLLQTADGWLQKTNDMLARMHELAVEAGDGTKTSADKANISEEYGQLQDEIARVMSSASKFNGKALFDATFASGEATQIGAEAGQTLNIELKNLTKGNTTDKVDGTVSWGSVIDSAELSVTTVSLDNIAGAIDHVSTLRASVGAQQSRLENTRAGLLSYEDNLRNAESRVRDVDMARESQELTKNQILTQVSNAMLAQANGLGQNVLQLI